MSTDPYASPSSTPPPGRSGAVTAVAVVNFVLGVLWLMCGGCVTFGGGLVAGLGGIIPQMENGANREGAEFAGGVVQVVGGLVFALGIAYVVFGILVLVAGYGVLNRQSWGRTMTLVLGGLAAVLAILALMGSDFLNAPLLIAYAVLVFAVLMNDRNAAEFR